MADDFDLRDPDSFLAGTVGPPGRRIFFLQATEAGHVVTLKLEKGQVWALGRLFTELLDAQGYDGPAAPPGELTEPVAAAWTVGRLATGVDTEAKIVVLIADELDDDDLDGDPEEDPHDPVGGTGDLDDLSSGDDSDSGEHDDDRGHGAGAPAGRDTGSDDAGVRDGLDAADDERNGGRARFHLDYAKARGFARQALRLVDEGRDLGKRNGYRPLAGKGK